MKKFYAFLYIHDGIIALVISLIISSLITAGLIILLGPNYSKIIAYVIAFWVVAVFIVLLSLIFCYIIDKISNYSYLKIYEDEKFYHQVYLKKQRIYGSIFD